MTEQGSVAVDAATLAAAPLFGHRVITSNDVQAGRRDIPWMAVRQPWIVIGPPPSIDVGAFAAYRPLDALLGTTTELRGDVAVATAPGLVVEVRADGLVATGDEVEVGVIAMLSRSFSIQAHFDHLDGRTALLHRCISRLDEDARTRYVPHAGNLSARAQSIERANQVYEES